MQFNENHLYHIYNRGNNQQQIFYNKENYLLFLRNIQKFIYPVTDIVAWCLMPTHFHLLIHASNKTIEIVRKYPVPINRLTEGIRLTLSSYTKAFQKQQLFTGNLFQQKTKSKCTTDGSINYAATAFHYIHQNPLTAGLCSKMEDWEFSSFQDYTGLRDGKLCNKELAFKLLDVNWSSFYAESYKVIADAHLKHLIKTGN